MTTQIYVPTIENGTQLSVGRWFKCPGDPVSSVEPLVEINTAKLPHEIHASVTGVLSDILVMDGESVEVDAPLGTIRQF